MSAPQPQVETWFERWKWLVWGVSGAAWLFLGLDARESGPTWYVVSMSAIGVLTLAGAAVEFRAHRRRVRY